MGDYADQFSDFTHHTTFSCCSYGCTSWGRLFDSATLRAVGPQWRPRPACGRQFALHAYPRLWRPWRHCRCLLVAFIPAHDLFYPEDPRCVPYLRVRYAYDLHGGTNVPCVNATAYGRIARTAFCGEKLASLFPRGVCTHFAAMPLPVPSAALPMVTLPQAAPVEPGLTHQCWKSQSSSRWGVVVTSCRWRPWRTYYYTLCCNMAWHGTSSITPSCAGIPPACVPFPIAFC